MIEIYKYFFSSIYNERNNYFKIIRNNSEIIYVNNTIKLFNKKYIFDIYLFISL